MCLFPVEKNNQSHGGEEEEVGQQQMMNLSTPTKQQQCATPTTPPNIKESHRRWKVEKGRSLQVKRLASQRSDSNDVPPKKKNKVCRVLYENIQKTKEMNPWDSFLRELVAFEDLETDSDNNVEEIINSNIKRRLDVMFEN